MLRFGIGIGIVRTLTVRYRLVFASVRFCGKIWLNGYVPFMFGGKKPGAPWCHDPQPYRVMEIYEEPFFKAQKSKLSVEV